MVSVNKSRNHKEVCYLQLRKEPLRLELQTGIIIKLLKRGRLSERLREGGQSGGRTIFVHTGKTRTDRVPVPGTLTQT